MTETNRVEIRLADGRALALRAAAPEDYEDLVRVYASTRAGELAQVTWWDDAQKLEFCRQQYDAQKREYDEHFPDAEYDVILLDGLAVGRLWVGRDESDIRLLDIALLPEAQNRGVGTEESKRTGKRLRHMVFILNKDALRFYERLGFEVFEDVGGYQHMEWRAKSDE